MILMEFSRKASLKWEIFNGNHHFFLFSPAPPAGFHPIVELVKHAIAKSFLYPTQFCLSCCFWLTVNVFDFTFFITFPRSTSIIHIILEISK